MSACTGQWKPRRSNSRGDQAATLCALLYGEQWNGYWKTTYYCSQTFP